MGSRLKRSLLLLSCLSILFYSTGLTASSGQESGGFWLPSHTREAVLFGYLSSGTEIRGTYSVAGSYFPDIEYVEFFIVDAANYTRYVDGLSYDRYSYESGVDERVQFYIPYNETWYGVFYNPSWRDLLHVNYDFYVGPPQAPQYIGLFVIFAFVGVVFTIIIASIIRSRPSAAVTPRTRPMVETTAEPAYEEIPFKEDKAKAPEDVLLPGLICPKCGYDNPADAEFCIRCGQKLQ